MDAIVTGCRAGGGHLVIVDGPPGTGKSAFLHEVSRQATGFLTLSAVCSEVDGCVPLGAVSALLHGADPALVERIRLLPPDVDDRDPAVTRLCHDIAMALTDLATETPVLVTVDDIRHADAATRMCLCGLASRLDRSALLVVLTDDGDPLGERTALRGALARTPSASRLRLGPLSPAGTAALLRERLGDGAASLTDDVVASTGGNPLLAAALAEDRLSDDPDLSAYRMAFLGCLHQGDGDFLRFAQALAVLGADADISDVAALMGTDEDRARRLRSTLAAAGLLVDGWFPDGSIVTAVRDSLSTSERTALHRKAAMLLHRREAAPTRIAEQLIEAGDTSQSWAGPVLAEAGDLALADGRVGLATKCIENIPAPRSHDADLAVRARLARAEWEADPHGAARHADVLSDAVRTGRLADLDSIMLVRQLLWHGRADEATRLLDSVRRRAGTDPAATAAVRDTERWLACTHPTAVRRRVSFTEPADRDRAGINTDPWLRRTAAFSATLATGARGDVDQAEEVLRDIHLCRDTGWADEVAVFAVLTLVAADRADTAAAWCARLRREADRRDSPTWRAVFAAVSGDVAIRRGDFESAAEYAETALSGLTPSQWGVAIGLPLGVAILANARLGRYRQAAARLAQQVPDETFEGRYGLHYLYSRGHYHLQTRHPHAALADFLTCGDLMRGWGLDLTNVIPWRAGAAEAWLALGNADQARQLAQDQLARSSGTNGRTRALSLRALAATSGTRRRPALLGEALELLEDSGDQFEQARVLADLGRSHAALEDARRARTVFRRAWHLAGRCASTPLREELLAVDGGLGGDTCDDSSVEARARTLTSSERRVAWLAVMGYKNREIADRLYVTPSTVEQHLTRIYKKLDVRGRHDLPGDLPVDPSDHVAPPTPH